MKIDVIIAREIEAPVDAECASPSTQVFLLLLIAKHQKGGIDGNIAAEPAVRRFYRPYVTKHSDRGCQGVDLMVGNSGQLEDKSCGTCSLIAGQHFALAELNLARKKCDCEDCRSDRHRRQA